MKALRVALRLAPVALLALALFACEGTETTNPNLDPGMAGRMVDNLGKPVEGATVKAIPEAKSAVDGGGAVDSVKTDRQGRYLLEGLPEGGYNLIGEYNRRGLVVLRPKVRYLGPKAYLDLGSDTLRAPGQIQGTVTLGGKPREGVFCYLPGTSYLSISDENGGCWLSNVPSGRYTVKYAQAGLATASDTGVVVLPGGITKLPAKDLGVDTAFPPPAPEGLKVEQDTAAGTVTLRWSPVKVADLDGYWIYRNEAGEDEPRRITDRLVRDTVYVDTVFRAKQDTVKRDLVYRVKAQDQGALLSAAYSPARALAAEPPQTARPLALFTAPDTVSRGDMVRIVADFRMARGRIDSIQWDRTLRDTAARRPGRAVRASSGSDTLLINFDDILPPPLDPRVRKCQYLSLWDSEGRRWRDSVAIRAIPDPPRPKAMGDTAVQVGQEFVLHATATDRFGKVIAWMWDLDNDKTWDYASRETGNFVHKFQTGGRRMAILMVTDDDQEVGYDTVNIDVGSFLDLETLPRDTVLRKAGNPWLIKRSMEIPKGVRLSVDPGAILRFAPKAGLRVRGVLEARGHAGDSIRMEADGEFSFGPGLSEPGIVFLGPTDGSPMDTGSILSYVAFRDSRIHLSNARPVVEYSRFRPGRADSALQGYPGLWFRSPGSPRGGGWVCRNNDFEDFPVRLWVDDLQGTAPAGAAPHRLVLFEANRIRGDQGLEIENSNRDSGWMDIAGNTLHLAKRLPFSEPAGFALGGTSRVLVRENAVYGAFQGVRIIYTSKAEIARNHFEGNRMAFRHAPIPGEFFTDYSGRFHHNRIKGSSQAAFSFSVHVTGTFDSNTVEEDGAAFVQDEFQAGNSSLHPGRDLIFRGNHWVSGGKALDAEGVTRKIRISEGARAKEFREVLLDPVLPDPPPGAGLP